MTMALILMLVGLLLLDALAWRYAADSRDSKDWQPGDWPTRDNR